jgi:hypothetical protein
MCGKRGKRAERERKKKTEKKCVWLERGKGVERAET